MAELRFAGVHKRFEQVEAVRGLDLAVRAGELLVLLGPSGSGKSTALRLAAGLEVVTAGRIWIGGRDVTAVPPADRNVSMVFQNYALFPHLTVAQNIGFGLRARGVDRRTAAAQIREAAELVGCEELLGRKPYQLSGGERQRVALARALVRHPAVFLLDEPLSNLDAQLRVRTRAELKRLHQRVGATMVYVTHDQVEALTMGDRVAVLDRGALQQLGTPAEVYRQPANRFVARFVGSPPMNLLPARTEEGVVRAGPFTLELPGVPAGRPLELGVRPEDVHVSAGGDGALARVEVVEPAGSETYLYLETDGHEFVARVAWNLQPDVGAPLRVELDPAGVYLFDADSGETLWRSG